MWRWIGDRLLGLRTWLAVRLGLWQGRWQRGKVRVAGAHWLPGPFAPRTWRFALYAPAGLADDEAAPLLIVLHGCRQQALGFAFAAGLTQLADRARLRLLCPQQRRLANPYRCWNWFAPQAQRGEGELRVIRAMLEAVERRVRVQGGAVAALGISAGGGLAALLAFHLPGRIRAAAVIAAPPLLGPFNMQDPRDVIKRGLLLPPATALDRQAGACARLAIVHGADDAVVSPRCAGQLQEQALESLRRGQFEVGRGETVASGAVTVTDFLSGTSLHVRRIEVAGLGHQWSGGPGGHPYCARGGAPLTDLCAQFLHEAGVLGQPAAPSEPHSG